MVEEEVIDNPGTVEQCPRCGYMVEIKSCNLSRCNNCGQKVRDCSDLA